MEKKCAVDIPRTNDKDSYYNGFEVILKLQLQYKWDGQDEYGKVGDDTHDTRNNR